MKEVLYNMDSDLPGWAYEHIFIGYDYLDRRTEAVVLQERRRIGRTDVDGREEPRDDRSRTPRMS